MQQATEQDRLTTVNIHTTRRTSEEIKRILGDVTSMTTCCFEMQCFLCDMMETRLTLLRPLYPILSEICSCFYLQKNMAAVTLTNHLLESVIKFSLVYKEGNGKTIDNPETMDTLFEQECKMYMGKDLGKNINALYDKGMITEEIKERLYHLKNLYRNPYSHASNNAIVGNATTEIVCGDLSNSDYIKTLKTNVATNPLLMVDARIDFINRTGLSYFQEVVNLAMILDSQLHQLYQQSNK